MSRKPHLVVEGDLAEGIKGSGSHASERFSEALRSEGSALLDRQRILLGALTETELSLPPQGPPPGPCALPGPRLCLLGRLAPPSSEQMSSRWPGASQGHSLQLVPASDGNKFRLKQEGFNKTQKTELIPGQRVFRTECDHGAEH